MTDGEGLATNDQEPSGPSGSQPDEAKESVTEQRLPMTDAHRRALISDRGGCGLMIFVVVFAFVGALILAVPRVIYKGRSLGDVVPIAVIFIVGFVALMIWNRHESNRDIRGGVFVRYTGPLAADGPACEHLVVGKRQIAVFDTERPALAAILPCRGAADVAPRTDLIFEIRDETGQVIYTGPDMRTALDQAS